MLDPPRLAQQALQILPPHTEDYMPLESIQFLVQHQTTTKTTLWFSDYTTLDEVWLASASGRTHARTMSSALRIMLGHHIGLSRDHFFHIDLDPHVIRALIEAALGS